MAQSKMLTVHRVQCYFPREGKTENGSLKHSVNGTHGIMPFSQKKSKTENHPVRKYTENDPVKNTVKDTQGRILFPPKRRKLKILQSKI